MEVERSNKATCRLPRVRIVYSSSSSSSSSFPSSTSKTSSSSSSSSASSSFILQAIGLKAKVIPTLRGCSSEIPTSLSPPRLTSIMTSSSSSSSSSTSSSSSSHPFQSRSLKETRMEDHPSGPTSTLLFHDVEDDDEDGPGDDDDDGEEEQEDVVGDDDVGGGGRGGGKHFCSFYISFRSALPLYACLVATVLITLATASPSSTEASLSSSSSEEWTLQDYNRTQAQYSSSSSSSSKPSSSSSSAQSKEGKYLVVIVVLSLLVLSAIMFTIFRLMVRAEAHVKLHQNFSGQQDSSPLEDFDGGMA